MTPSASSQSTLDTPCTAFVNDRRIASGRLQDVILAAKEVIKNFSESTVFIFSDENGQIIEVDLQERPVGIIDESPATVDAREEEKRKRGRPKLGVVSREVTLLPRHWEWLDAQPGGASVALRKLVESARRSSSESDKRRASQEAVYRCMSVLAGNLAGYEEALRAVYRRDQNRFTEATKSWSIDLRDHLQKLSGPVWE